MNPINIEVTLALMQKDIEILKQQVKEMESLKEKVTELFYNISSLRQVITSLEESLQQTKELLLAQRPSSGGSSSSAPLPAGTNALIETLLKIIGLIITAILAYYFGRS